MKFIMCTLTDTLGCMVREHIMRYIPSHQTTGGGNIDSDADLERGTKETLTKVEE